MSNLEQNTANMLKNEAIDDEKTYPGSMQLADENNLGGILECKKSARYFHSVAVYRVLDEKEKRKIQKQYGIAKDSEEKMPQSAQSTLRVYSMSEESIDFPG